MSIRTLASIAPFAITVAARGQSAGPAAFVANNGNLEGSISSFTFSPSGAPVFVSKIITGTAPNTSTPNAGTNPQCISLSPNGMWIATGHGTISSSIERIMIHRVNADATMAFVGTYDTPDSPLDCEWVSDELLAVANTDSPSNIIMYRFTPPAAGGPALVEIDRETAGVFTAYVAVHPNGRLLYGGDSSGFTLWGYSVNVDGTLEPLGGTSTGGIYPIGAGITRDGARLYAGGGISSSGNKVIGFDIQFPSGALNPMPSSPFVSPGTSPAPKLAVASEDDALLFVGHGSSAAIRSFAIDPGTGALTDTGFAFDVGVQGSLGDAAVLGDLLLVTDNFDGPTGLYAFTIQANGSFTVNGGLVSTQGVSPRGIAPWKPPAGCYPDCNNDGVLTAADFGCFQTVFVTGGGDPYPDCNGDGQRTAADFGCFQTRFVQGCP